LFILIAHEKEPYFQADGNMKKYSADVRGSLKSMLPKQFKEVYYCYEQGGKWMWLTQPMTISTGQRFARTTLDQPKFIPMDYGVLLARWEGKYQGGTEPKVED
jgi:hypothetical protein